FSFRLSRAPEHNVATDRSQSSWRPDGIVTRVLLYYATLAAVVFVGRALLPERWIRAIAVSLEAGGIVGGAITFPFSTGTAAPAPPPGTLALAAAIAIASACLLSLPVAWLYILTRQKKGYRQSVVQTLIVLPLVVAGVVVLVKHSLALAFSLAGIVAAVRFRNTLEDSKDAVYIFLATGIGLACGVRLEVAVVLSVAFNLVALLLWQTDFGSTPAPLEGARAQRRLDRALAVANRTGMFLARMDDEVLKSMSPEQLDALADRAWRRRKRYAEGEEIERPEFESLLRVRTRDPEAVRQLAGAVLDDTTARWRYGGVLHEDDGTHVVEFSIALGDHRPAVLTDSFRRAGASAVLELELR
ncbi:MAG TPA: DUF4956 domain-containing protein, partial [Gemmatimonadaceae bacterium]|nr:DUF4956 domain-containing protein [Gemmatimonadaceae bacterium]